MQTIDSSKAAENVTGSDGAIHIPSNPTLAGLASLTRNVAYKTGADDLVMDIIAPQSTGDDDNRRYPTVVFVQGSAWTTPHRDYEIPQLSALAREGFVVATVSKQPSAISGQTRVNGTWTPTVSASGAHRPAATRHCWWG